MTDVALNSNTIDRQEVFDVLAALVDQAVSAGPPVVVMQDGARDVAQELFEVHQRQWDYESACRQTARSRERGDLKKLIDDSNAQRIALINRIDKGLEAMAHSSQPAILWPLTVGQMVDTVLIALVKSERLAPHADASIMLNHGLASTRSMTALIAASSVTLPPRSTIKNYSRVPLTTEVQID